jgi:hypothetical protein
LVVTIVEQDQAAGADARRALLAERYGSLGALTREQHRRPQPRQPRGIAAPRCRVCLVEHDQALATRQPPPAVARAVPGSDRCREHQKGGSRAHT